MDRDLVTKAQQGDQRAFESLTAANHDRLFRVAQGILRDPHLAEDATQQAFLDIWRHIQRLRDPSKFEGWSYRLVVNACYDEAKRKPKWMSDSVDRPAEEPRERDAFGAVDDRDQLDRGFQRLSLDHRNILVLSIGQSASRATASSDRSGRAGPGPTPGAAACVLTCDPSWLARADRSS